jgi:hypothetical protein
MLLAFKKTVTRIHIGNGCCGGQPRGRSVALISNGRQVTTVTDVGACNGC